MDDLFDEMRIAGLVSTWLDEAIIRHPDKVELRLADSVSYRFELWDIDMLLAEQGRWN